MSGCVTTRLLQEDEYLLGKQQIKGTQKVSKKALARCCKQQSHPFLLWMYQLGQRNFDKEAIQQRMVQIEADFDAKIAAAAGDAQAVQRLKQKRAKKIQARKKLLQKGNRLMRLGAPPVLYSAQQQALTEQDLLAYLQSRGYFKAQVSSTVKRRNQRAFITYRVRENKPYLIEVLRLRTADQAIEKLLQAQQQQSLLKKGARYDQEVLCQERERIYALLSNHGYYSFDKQQIWFDVDKTAMDNAVVIETVIGVPAGQAAHPIACVDQVTWDVDADQEVVSQEGATVCGGITFRGLNARFNPQLLAKKLPLHLPQLYSRQALFTTQQRLARLGVFKYVRITCERAENGSLVPHIHTAPVDRWQLTHELGLQVSAWLPSPFYKLSLAGTNLFGRLETLALATHVGAEGIARPGGGKGLAFSDTLGLDLSLAWPQCLLPLKRTTQAHLERFNPKTKLSVGCHFTQKPDYTQETFKGFLSYGWQDRGYGTYEFIPLRIDLQNTSNKSDSFEERLKKWEKQDLDLFNLFKPSWIGLFSFRSTFRENSDVDKDPSCWLLDLFFESGGALQSFIDLRKAMPKLTYYRYVKFDSNYSQSVPMRSGTVFAYRIHAGIAKPYGGYSKLPYDRYYAVGGASDMRAWKPHSLGPGTYRSPQDAADKHLLGHLGELSLQGSAELRQQLVGSLEGALFVDVGNVWTLRADGRPGGQFSLQDFYKAIAIGTGFGVRFKFGFLVLRLDLGIKLYDPSRPPGARFVGRKLALNRHLGLPDQAVVCFSIGYPF